MCKPYLQGGTYISMHPTGKAATSAMILYSKIIPTNI